MAREALQTLFSRKSLLDAAGGKETKLPEIVNLSDWKWRERSEEKRVEPGCQGERASWGYTLCTMAPQNGNSIDGLEIGTILQFSPKNRQELSHCPTCAR